MSGPRIAVVGAGANGASIGADLIEAGHDVTLVEQWPAHVEAMRRDGVRIEMVERTVTVRPRVLHLSDVATLRETFDVVLIVTKAYDARWAAELIRRHLADRGLVVGVQNGMSAGPISEVVGPGRSLGCVIEVSSTLLGPGVVRRYSGPDASWFAVGSVDAGGVGREEEVAELLRCAGEVAVVDGIIATKWMKLVSNSSVLAPTATLGLPMVDAIGVPGMRDVMIRAGQEALSVGAAQGLPILPIFGLTSQEVEHADRVVETMLDRLYARFTKPGAITTVLQDWQQGRRSEVDDINGHVVSSGLATGVATPVNDGIVELAHRIERGETAPGLHLADELLAL